MPVQVEIRQSLDDTFKEEYQSFLQASGASFFYDWKFLRAAERSPLLPVDGTYYLLARDEGRLVSFLPAYLQRVSTVDPFGLLARTAGIAGDGGQRALFSHVMHCFDTTVIGIPGSSDPLPALMQALKQLARDIDARYTGLLNVAESGLLGQLSDHELAVRHLVDRYFLDLTPFTSFDELLLALPKEGRYEMNRQLRKFDAGEGTVTVLEPPFDHRLEQLAALCQQTTARNGTPQYFPADALAGFVRICGDLARLVVVEKHDTIAGGFICFVDKRLVCVWSAGMRYDLTDYSPYTVSFAHVYRWSMANGIATVEAGRLNERIKLRLGLKPLPLYSATSEVAASPSCSI